MHLAQTKQHVPKIAMIQFWMCVLSSLSVMSCVSDAWSIMASKKYPFTALNSRRVDMKEQTWFDGASSPFIAVITEPDACHSYERMNETIQAIQAAVSSSKVTLVSVRTSKLDTMVPMEDFEERVVELTRRIVSLSQTFPFLVVVSSDWVLSAVKAGAHGIHVKESHQERIPDIRRLFSYQPIIGTSTHAIDSALNAWSLFQPDYFFAGTCYTTASHPEKNQDKLEGPGLPGKVKVALLERGCTSPVLAIGGIDEHCCDEPIRLGADGIATIRAVLQSQDPEQTIKIMYTQMITDNMCSNHSLTSML